MIKSFFSTLKEMFFSVFGLPIMTFKVYNHSLYYYDKESNELEYFSYKNKVVTFPSDYKNDIIYFEGYKLKKLEKEKTTSFGIKFIESDENYYVIDGIYTENEPYKIIQSEPIYLTYKEIVMLQERINLLLFSNESNPLQIDQKESAQNKKIKHNRRYPVRAWHVCKRKKILMLQFSLSLIVG